jgi:eukaryotic-like serine/threonine-protein kinase
VCASVGETVTSDAPSAPAPAAAARREPEVGALLGGRYRLHRPVAVGAACTVWIADDTVLERRVAVKILTDATPDGDGADHAGEHAAFLERARLTARVEHPAIATTFDSGRDGCLFSVAELAPGDRLEDVVAARGPVTPACAVLLARQLVEALHAVERSGVSYGGVDLDDIVITGADGLTVTALRPRDDEDMTVQPAASVAVGTALYVLLCGRQPVLSAAGTLLSPRQLRADVPRVLDELVLRALRGLYLSAAAVGAALAALPPLEEPAARSVRVAPRPHRRVRRDTLLVSGVLLVAVLSVVVGVLFSSEGGRSFIRRVVPDVPVINPTPQPAPTVPASTDAEPGASAAFDADLAQDLDRPAAAAVELGDLVSDTTAHDFDPRGDDGTENPETIGAVVDGDVSTAWTSQQYANTEFGNLKPGMGLWIEVPPGTEVSAVSVRSTEGGWAASIRVADAPSDALADWGPDRATVGVATGGSDQLVLDRPQTGAAVLVWFTKLPPSRVMTVTEIEVLGTVPSSPDGA